MGVIKKLFTGLQQPALPPANHNAVLARDWRGGDLVLFRAKPQGCSLCSPFFQRVFSLSGRDARYAPYHSLPPSLCEDRCPACGTWIGWSNYDPETERVSRQVAQEVFGDYAKEKADVAHAANQVRKFKQLSAGCLDPKLKAKYDERLGEWEGILKTARAKLTAVKKR